MYTMDLRITWKVIAFTDIITKEWISKKTNEPYKISFRTIVIEELEWQYPNVIAAQVNEKALNNMKEEPKAWDTVEVGLNFRTSESNGNYYTNISVWMVNKVWSWAVDLSNEWADDLPF